MRILRPSRIAVLAVATPVLAAGGTVLAATAAGDHSAPGVTVTRPAVGASTFETTPRLAGGAGYARGDSSTVTVRL